jgi:hypothetical protein
MKPDWTDADRESLATDWWFGLQEVELILAFKPPQDAPVGGRTEL